MKLLTLVYLDAKHTFRTLFPWKLIRIVLIGFLILLGLGLLALFALKPLKQFHGSTPAELLNIVSAHLGLAIGANLFSLSLLLKNPDRLRLYRYAPVSPATAGLAPLLASLIPTLFVLGIFFLPFMVLELRRAPFQALELLCLGGIALFWSLTISIAVLVPLTQILGREKASKLGMVPAVILAVLPVTSLQWLRLRVVPPETTGVVVLLSLLILPPLTLWLLSRFFTLLGIDETPSLSSKIVHWGSPMLHRMLFRGSGPWALPGIVLLFLYGQRFQPHLLHLYLGILIVTLCGLCLNQVLGPEHQNQLRLQLAPQGQEHLRMLFFRVAVPNLLFCLVLVVFLGQGRHFWQTCMSFALIAHSGTFFLMNKSIRGVSQGLIYAAVVLVSITPT